MTTEEYKNIVRRWIDSAWNNGDFSSAEELYSPDYVLHYGSTPDSQGAAGLLSFISIYRNAMPDLHMEIEDMLGEGDKVTWRVFTTGTQTGDFLGIPPSGRRGGSRAIIVSRFEGGKWREDWVNNDDLGLFQQLGVIPALGQEPAAVS